MQPCRTKDNLSISSRQFVSITSALADSDFMSVEFFFLLRLEDRKNMIYTIDHSFEKVDFVLKMAVVSYTLIALAFSRPAQKDVFWHREAALSRKRSSLCAAVFRAERLSAVKSISLYSTVSSMLPFLSLPLIPVMQGCLFCTRNQTNRAEWSPVVHPHITQLSSRWKIPAPPLDVLWLLHINIGAARASPGCC